MTTFATQILAGVLVALTSLAWGAEEKSISEITPEDIGEFVTVTGTAAGFYLPEEPRAPFAFNVAESSGSLIRVTAWPDIFERVDNRDALKTTGSQVRLTAEVAEYKEKLELHLQDWEEIDIAPGVGAQPQLPGADEATSAPVTNDRSTSAQPEL